MTPRGALARADRAIAAALRAISVASLCALFATVAFVVVTRVFGLRSAGWTDELIELSFGWLIFPCAASLWRTKSHFTVDLLEQTIASPAVRRALGIAVEVLCLVFRGVRLQVGGVRGGEACVRALAGRRITRRDYWYARC
jgi:TRAP-type C4-dicarboxylate transport system permease small subunit